jgi:acrylyl-CoA reductase (NADPH)
MTLRALYLERTAAGETRATLRDLDEVERPQIASDTVTIDVGYSTLNYKDALAITGISPIVRRFPMVAGIDFAGRVIESRDDRWRRGDEVALTGWHASETHWGGLAQRAWIPAHWLIRKPSTLTLWETMAIGTAGFTAALCVRAIERHGIASGSGDVLVTGATGGVGSLAIMLLAAAGFRVVASTGKHDHADYLRRLGAAKIIDRSTLGAPGKPLQSERWAAAVDTVGSHTLANICAQTRINGIVTACGLAQGMDFPATVAPFILRGVTLEGVNSIFVAPEARLDAWARLEQFIDRARLHDITQEIGLSDVVATVPRFLAGQVAGRIVVDVNR